MSKHKTAASRRASKPVDRTQDGQVCVRLSSSDLTILEALADHLKTGRRALIRRALREMFAREHAKMTPEEGQKESE